MEFLNYEHSKKFSELQLSDYSWINTNDKENMAILFLISASDELHEAILPYFTTAGLNVEEMKQDKENSLEITTMLNLAAALYDDSQAFYISDLSNLDKNMLQLALNAMQYRYSPSVPFRYEAQQTHSIINENEAETKQYYGLTNFSDYVQEKGLDFDKRKLSVYRERGLLPKPAVQVGRNNGWSKEQIDEWIDKYNKDEIVSRYGRDKK